MSNQGFSEENFEQRRFILLNNVEVWSDRLVELLRESGVLDTAIELYTAKPIERSDSTELLEFLVHYINIVEEEFSNTRHALIYPEDDEEDTRNFEFKRNVIIKALNKAGAEASVYWNDEDKSKLLELYKNGATDAEIGLAIGRTELAIAGYRRVNDLPKLSQWTDAEKNQLRELFAQGLSDEEIGILLTRPTSGVWQQRMKLRLLREEPTVEWNEDEILELKRLLRIGYTPKEIYEGKFLQRTRDSIQHAINTLELNGEAAYQWTDEEESTFIDLIETNYTEKEIAELLDRPVWQIIQKRISKGFFPEKDTMDEIQLIKFLDSEAKFTSPKISELTGINSNTVGSRITRLRNNPEFKAGPAKWTEEEKEKLWNLYTSGTSAEDLATEFSRTERAIRHIITALRKEKLNQEQ